MSSNDHHEPCASKWKLFVPSGKNLLCSSTSWRRATVLFDESVKSIA